MLLLVVPDPVIFSVLIDPAVCYVMGKEYQEEHILFERT